MPQLSAPSPVELAASSEGSMNSIVYLVGAVVIVVAVLSFFGLR
jgi:hypothetical protein